MEIKNIKELVKATLADSQNLYFEFSFGKLHRKQAKALEAILGVNLTGAEWIIDSHSIRHAMKRHSDANKEAKHGQVAITPTDFSLIPQIVQQPDSIEYAGKNKMKQDVFNYKKRIGALYIVCEAVRRSKNGHKIALASMYKKK